MFILYLIAGSCGALNSVLWGIYGDLLKEPFALWKVLRSLGFGLGYSILLYIVDPGLPLLVVALSVLALERITTEIYKAFLRQEAQEKYLIPSDLNLRIPLVLRRGIGLILLFCIWSMVLFWDPQIQPTVLVMVFGIVSALGGMAKDAPYEGIEPVKFFRTPVLTVVSALGIQALFSDLASKFFLLAIGGAERVLSESYKKYIRGRVPGKFKSPEIHNTDWQEKRKVVTPLYLMNLLAFIVLAVLR